MRPETIARMALKIRMATTPDERRRAWLLAYSTLQKSELDHLERLIKRLEQAARDWHRFQDTNGK